MSRRASDRPIPFCFLALIVILAMGVASCGDDDDTGDAGGGGVTVTTALAGDIVFGEGRIPDGFPEDFPVPAAATVGSTLVDPNRGLFEVILFLPSDQDAAIVFYEANLVAAGYTIDASGFDGAVWRMEFSRDGERGGAVIRLEDTGVATVAIDLTID